MNISLPSNRPPRILITRTDRIGDLVLSTPVFKEIRKKFPKAWIACLTFLENREIVTGNPFLDEVILYDKEGSEHGFFGNLKFAAALAAKKFDIVVHLHATNRMHLVSWLAGIPVRIGWRRKYGWALTHSAPDLKREGRKHEAQYNFDLLKPLGISCPGSPELLFPFNGKFRESFRQLILNHSIPEDRPWIVLNPSASCPSKIWPAARFGELVTKIARQYDAVFIAIGTRNDRRLIEQVKRATSVPVYDLSGRLTLGMLAELLKNSSLLISNDSGPVHIAAAVGTPVVAIFGRKQPGLSPTRWRPLGEKSRVVWKDVGCTECLAHNCQIHFLCLDVISSDDVLFEIENLLGRGLKHAKKEAVVL